MENIEIVSPIGRESIGKQNLAPRLDTLAGKTIGESWNLDFKGDIMFPIYRELLKERFPDVNFIPYTEFPKSTLSGMPEYQKEVSQQIASVAKEKGCDAMISGNGG
jgi:hypothetical protein